jgi:hypothetical protein
MHSGTRPVSPIPPGPSRRRSWIGRAYILADVTSSLQRTGAALSVLAVAALASIGPLLQPSAAAAPQAAEPHRSEAVLAQAEESENQGGDDAPAETGGQGETEGGGEETGPPWTYQMSRISVVMLVGLVAGIGWVYYKLVVKRSRREA